jgi:membrane associated rhomboid family serine protease
MARVTPVVTYTLIAACVLAFFVFQGGGMGTVGRIAAIDAGAIYGPAIADGEWWRVITGAFLHGSLLHLGFNMYALYLFGPVLETRYGHVRYAALYLIGGVWGSAGALLLEPNAYTVGASGAIFGLLAAMFVAERRHGVPMMGGVGVWIVLNLVITFAIPGISVGGHIGGLIGGGLAGLLYEATARRRSTALAVAGTVALLAAAAVATIVAVG